MMRRKELGSMGSVHDYRVSSDLKLVREMQGLTQEALAKELKINTSSISRWETGLMNITPAKTEAFYNYAYDHGIMLNRIKQQFYREELTSETDHLLFHGAKDVIKGAIRADASRSNNDFGTGFYCGESLMQSSLFVSGFQGASVYIVSFDTEGLKKEVFHVNTEWMLAIALFRGRLKQFQDDIRLRHLREKVERADYIVAPIADNRMYAVITDYINGEITDEQCRHSLAATDLGLQYVMKSQKAADRVIIRERCYLCEAEKKHYLSIREQNQKEAADKVTVDRGVISREMDVLQIGAYPLEIGL